MRRSERSWCGLLGLGLLLSAAACDDSSGKDNGGSMRPPPGIRSNLTALMRAQSCDDLLTKIQDDAIAKLDLTVEQYKQEYKRYGGGSVADAGIALPPDFTVGQPAPTAPPSGAEGGGTGGGAVSDPNAGPSRGDSDSAGGGGDGVVGSSDTNTQVEGVDEADFIKMVDSGRGMFLLHGNTLRKLKTFPASELSLEESALEIEGQPSELFVTDDGRAVIFSSVHGYGQQTGGGGGSIGKPFPGGGADGPAIDVCYPGGYCGGFSHTKITVADLSGATPTTLRELYYQGSYVSSRRHDDVVRVVLQGQTTYAGLFSPDVRLYDSFGRPYEEAVIAAQLEQWRDRTADDIRDTQLSDWLPLVREAKDGQLVAVQPACDTFYVPQPGVADYGLTHVLSLDVSDANAPLGGVTVMGQASTVYSNHERLVLAQPDYRWADASDRFGVIDEQRTSLHVFQLDKASTDYLASGWVEGHLPHHNPQFGIDVASDQTLRIVTTGRKRKHPEAEPGSTQFWEQTVANHVFTVRQSGKELSLVGSSENLGHVEQGETVHSARFVGNRAYVVTFRQTDPLIVLDVSQAAQPTVLGQIEIPGFSQYMHPLDETHLITFGQSGERGQQLQLFDVTDPANLPQPKVLDFGVGGWSELANNHKAFTFYARQNLIALPVSGYVSDPISGYQRQSAGLQVVKVNAQTGFELLATIDHSDLYQQQACLVCDGFRGCYYQCSYGGVEMRRGHFVETTDSTFVYGISHAAVSVSDLAQPATPVKSVLLPQPALDGQPWYPDPLAEQDGGTNEPQDAGVAMPPLPEPGADPVPMP